MKQIANAYKIVKQRFQQLKHQHLQLIKTAVECPAVVDMMRRSNLYSTNGRRRFQELRDNLTTQFQLQERNNMILNSWIITYGLCGPFVEPARNLDEFIQRMASIEHLDESSLDHLKSMLIERKNYSSEDLASHFRVFYMREKSFHLVRMESLTLLYTFSYQR